MATMADETGSTREAPDCPPAQQDQSDQSQACALTDDALESVAGGAQTISLDRTGASGDDEDIALVTCPLCKKKIRPTLYPDHLRRHFLKG